jgi:hypothetical protein
LVGRSDRKAEKSVRFVIKFQIKHVLNVSIGKLLMSLSFCIHIWKRKQIRKKIKLLLGTITYSAKKWILVIPLQRRGNLNSERQK